MPISRRRWFIDRLQKESEREKEEFERAKNGEQ